MQKGRKFLAKKVFLSIWLKRMNIILLKNLFREENNVFRESKTIDSKEIDAEDIKEKSLLLRMGEIVYRKRLKTGVLLG